jgi:hypothetical protein
MARSKAGPVEQHHWCPVIGSVLPNGAQKFNERVELWFEDGSYASFEYAQMTITGPFIDVYTEHCGYHRFLKATVRMRLRRPYGHGHMPPDPSGAYDSKAWKAKRKLIKRS